GEGFHPVWPRSRRHRLPPPCLHHFVSHPAQEEGGGLGEPLGPVTMQFFVREPCTMIAAPVQCDVDGIPKGSHYVRAPIALGRPNENSTQFLGLIPSLPSQSPDKSGVMGRILPNHSALRKRNHICGANDLDC